MNRTDRQTGIHEVLSFEVDEFDFICGTICGGDTLVEGETSADKQLVPFKEIFSDAKTRSVFVMLLEHVRETSETISFPYRCDTETHCVFLRAIVSKSSSKRVGFLNKVMGYEPRHAGIRLVQRVATDHSDFTVCSICNRLSHNDTWQEFQQLVDQRAWPGNNKVMHCSFDSCSDCVNAISQRVAETQRSYNRKVA